jgi:hypothetical protein
MWFATAKMFVSIHIVAGLFFSVSEVLFGINHKKYGVK